MNFNFIVSIPSGERATVSEEEMRTVEGVPEFLKAAADNAKLQCVEFNLNGDCPPAEIADSNYQCLSQKPGSSAQFRHIDLGGEGIQVRLSVFTWRCCIRVRLTRARTVPYVCRCQLFVSFVGFHKFIRG